MKLASTSRLLLPALVLAAAACTTTTAPVTTEAPANADPVRMVETVRAAAGSGEGELSVQPLRDSTVEDLRQQAMDLEKQGDAAGAAAALDQALAITPDDPAVLQERAEVALLLGDFAGAETRALRAFQIGSQVGPLCRRHWAAVRAARYASNNGAGAAEANTQLQACKIAAPERF